MKFYIDYRGGEITAKVEAKTEEEAIDKFIEGNVESYEVSFDALWHDFCEATPDE